MDNNNTNLTNITLIFLFRLGTVERLENIRAAVNFLFQHSFQNIRVLEAAGLCNGFVKKLLGKRINYTFLNDDDPVFHRTRYINQMVTEATTPYVVVWDTDVIAPSKQVTEAFRLLETGEADFVLTSINNSLIINT